MPVTSPAVAKPWGLAKMALGLSRKSISSVD